MFISVLLSFHIHSHASHVHKHTHTHSLTHTERSNVLISCRGVIMVRPLRGVRWSVGVGVLTVIVGGCRICTARRSPFRSCVMYVLCACVCVCLCMRMGMRGIVWLGVCDCWLVCSDYV